MRENPAKAVRQYLLSWRSGLEAAWREASGLPRWRLLRSIALIWLAFLMLVTLLTVWLYRSASEDLDTRLMARQQLALDQLRQLSVQGLESIARDLIFLAQTAKQGHGEPAQARRLELFSQDALALARSRGQAVDQIRLISASGREVVRIDAGPGGHFRVAAAALQDKAQRYYVRASLAQPPSTIYMSPLDLNVERGAVATPFKPMLRMGLKVNFESPGSSDLVVINYLGTHLTDMVRLMAEPGGSQIWLLNEDGYWLVGPSDRDEWGFMFADKADSTLAKAEPALWQRIQRASAPGPSSGLIQQGLLSSLSLTPAAGLEVQGFHLVGESSSRWHLVAWLSPSQRAQEQSFLLSRYWTQFAGLATLFLLVSIGVGLGWHIRQAFVARLRQRDQQIVDIFAGVPQAILVTNAQGVLVDVNMQAEALLGCTRTDLLNQPVAHLFVSMRGVAFDASSPLWAAGGWPKALSGVVSVYHTSGREVPVLVKVSEIQSEHGQLWVGSVRDVSAELEAEQALLDINLALEDSNQKLEFANQEMNAFAYSVSHDLRSPLRSIMGMSQILTKSYAAELTGEAADFLKRIGVAASRMNNLIDDLLALSRVSTAGIDLSDVDLSEMVNSIVQELRERAPDRQVEVKIQPGLQVHADKSLMRVMMTNLLENAWKYTSKTDEAKIDFGQASFDGELMFFLKDNGAGFDLHTADELFEPFQRFHRSEDFPGTGIGLATVKRVVRRHGGRILAVAEVNRGAEFRFLM